MKLISMLASVAIIGSSFFCVPSFATNDIDLQGFDLGSGSAPPQKSKPIHNQDTAKKNASTLFHNANDPIRGNTNGQITLVEFMDFKCSYCKHMEPVIESLIGNNSDLRVVIKEYPVKGPVSTYAAKAALAAKKQGKYMALHKALMDASDLSEEKVLELASSVGVNTTQLKKDMESKAISQQIQSNISLAQQLQIQGTPAFFIVKTDLNSPIDFIMGAADQSSIQDSINKMKN